MAEAENRTSKSEPQRIFVKADEIDTGTTILTPSQQLPLSALAPPDASAPAAARPKAPPRPSLRRDGSAASPSPPSQPPPAPPSQPAVEMTTDSLSLPQLKQLVSQFPKVEQRAYAFQYADSEDFPVEIEEWFHYTEGDHSILLGARDTFEQTWLDWSQQSSDPEPGNWVDISQQTRGDFLRSQIPRLASSQGILHRTEALECLLFILTGAWGLTAGLENNQEYQDDDAGVEPDRARWNAVQIHWMHQGADLLAETDGGESIRVLTKCLQDALGAPGSEPSATQSEQQEGGGPFDDYELHEMSLCFSCLYILIESIRSRKNSKSTETLRAVLLNQKPSFLVFIVDTISRLRWDENCNIPISEALHLFWKSLLFLFGDIKHDLEHTRRILEPRIDRFSAEAAHPILTASPLDYHLFRQEVTSKYPAYNPPLPLVPLEVEQKSMLPPLPYNTGRFESNGLVNGHFPSSGTGASILHQPVHIATPAPSPPPSPVGPGGKTGKKQNYQTNQNFPFLYPPLDDSSNMIGGKGTTEFQDLMVGKKWEGSDIPASIIEAGELFASRMRMTRAMRQLWRERDLFLKYDRGWRGSKAGNSRNTRTPKENRNEATTADLASDEDEDQAKIANDEDIRSRLDTVEEFFHHALPNLQSLVIVMMKVMLRNVQEIAIQNGGFQDQGRTEGLNRSKSNANMTQNQTLPMPPAAPQPSELSLEDLEAIRSREISQKALSGAIFVLLKWFKTSHVLKFEYLTQLLLDSNYLQLTLKYFAHQNLEELVSIKYDRDEEGFFHFCHLNSDHPPLSPTSPRPDSDTSSLDDAAPLPILRRPISASSPSSPDLSSTIPRPTASPLPIDPNDPSNTDPLNDPNLSLRPTVDELGNPLAPLPQTPITHYSFRTFQTTIHLLRALQKLTRSKSHRILLLVQFKSSQILRRLLRIPDPTLRLYVLKLFKSQVPYCGRKWRQSNMRVITAIYLHCRPELRDEWLAGMHDGGGGVEGEVDEAVPLEWALRGLTFWWQRRMYGDVMRLRTVDQDGMEVEGGQEIEDGERDFFQRELDQMGWGVAGLGVGEDVAFGEEAAGVDGVNGVNGGSGGEQWEQGGQGLEAW